MIHAPVTLEGWQAWEVAGRALTVAMVGRRSVTMLDRALALSLAGTLGYDTRAVALLLPAIEDGLWAAAGALAERDGKDVEETDP